MSEGHQEFLNEIYKQTVFIVDLISLKELAAILTVIGDIFKKKNV